MKIISLPLLSFTTGAPTHARSRMRGRHGFKHRHTQIRNTHNLEKNMLHSPRVPSNSRQPTRVCGRRNLAQTWVPIIVLADGPRSAIMFFSRFLCAAVATFPGIVRLPSGRRQAARNHGVYCPPFSLCTVTLLTFPFGPHVISYNGHYISLAHAPLIVFVSFFLFFFTTYEDQKTNQTHVTHTSARTLLMYIIFSIFRTARLRINVLTEPIVPKTDAEQTRLTD